MMKVQEKISGTFRSWGVQELFAASEGISLQAKKIQFL
jgi:hypothetical protein